MSDWSLDLPETTKVDYATRIGYDGVNAVQLRHRARAIPLPEGHVDAITATELMTAGGRPPYDWQLELLGVGIHQWRLGAVSRQGGKTSVQAAGALEKVSQMTGRVGVLLPSQDQAIDVLVEIRDFYLKAVKGGFGNRMPELTNTEAKRPSRLFFSNGSSIVAMTSESGNATTGYGATNRGGPLLRLIVDEAAFVRQDAVLSLVPALASTNGDMIITSTVWTDFGWFYETLNGEGDLKYLFHVVRKTAADIPHISEDHLRQAKILMKGKPGAFEREYYLVPPPRLGGLITAEAIMSLQPTPSLDPLEGWVAPWNKAS